MPRFLDLEYREDDEWGPTSGPIEEAAPKREPVVSANNPAKPAYDALVWLAARCDHASAHDGIGFSKYDSQIGHSLAQTISKYGRVHSARQFEIVKRLCRRYRKQLADGGFDLDAVLSSNFDVKPPHTNAPKVDINRVRVWVVGDRAIKCEDAAERMNWWPRSQMVNIVRWMEGEEAQTVGVEALRPGDTISFLAPVWLAKKKGITA